MTVDVVAHAHLDAFRGAGVGADALAAAVGLGDGGGGLLVGEVGVLGALGAGDLLARHRQLDLVDTESMSWRDGLAHAVGPSANLVIDLISAPPVTEISGRWPGSGGRGSGRR
jgi:hypothetical protein